MENIERLSEQYLEGLITALEYRNAIIHHIADLKDHETILAAERLGCAVRKEAR